MRQGIGAKAAEDVASGGTAKGTWTPRHGMGSANIGSGASGYEPGSKARVGSGAPARSDAAVVAEDGPWS